MVEALSDLQVLDPARNIQMDVEEAEIRGSSENFKQAITKKTSALKAVAHITGGGLTENLPRVISEEFSSEILLSDYPATPLYSWIKHNSQLEDEELMKTFNCGIGLVMVFDSGKFEDTRNILESENIPFALIGKVIKKEKEPVIYCGKLNL